jgi:glycosyltransferase involved in cell wall biosynthesis
MPDILVSSPKKPAIIMTRFPYASSWGGEESHTLAIARHLRDRGYEVIFMGSCPILLEQFKSSGFIIRPTWGGKMCVTPWELIKSFLFFPFIKWNLARVFTELRADYDVRGLYCLSLNEKLLLAPEAIRHKIPLTWIEHQEVRGWLLKSPWKSLYRANAIHAKIVPISKKNAKSLLDLGVAKENLVEIINGVDLSVIRLSPKNHEKGLIVYANRFIPKKGVQDFLEALKILFQGFQNVKIVIVGEGELEEKIRAEILQSFQGRDIQIYNFLKKEKWYELLAKADIFVSCARDSNETFSLNAAEALSNGCKLVVTNCCGIADYLQDGLEAFFVKPMDPIHLAEKIREALAVDDSIRERAMEVAREKFDQKRMLQEYENLLTSLK